VCGVALTDKQNAKVSAFATTSLEPGEQIVAVLGLAMTGPSAMLVALLSTWLIFLQKRFAVVLTDRRLIVIRLKTTLTGYPPKVVDGAYPRSSVKVTFSHGTITGKLVIEAAGRESLSLSVPRIYESGAEQVANALA
jgi:hypothetical protein